MGFNASKDYIRSTQLQFKQIIQKQTLRSNKSLNKQKLQKFQF